MCLNIYQKGQGFCTNRFYKHTKRNSHRTAMTAAADDPEEEEEIQQRRMTTTAADPFTNIDNRKRSLQQRANDQQDNINRKKHQEHRRAEPPADKATVPSLTTKPPAPAAATTTSTNTATITSSNFIRCSIDDDSLPPLADWPALHERILTLIRTQQFGTLYETTNYPLPQKHRRHQQRHRHQNFQLRHCHSLPRSRETVVPGTRSVRTSGGYRYYDTTTTTPLEISGVEYQRRYERVLVETNNKMDWSRYFIQLRWQKSMAQTANTVAQQMQRARQIYSIHLTELQHLHYHQNDDQNDDDDDDDDDDDEDHHHHHHHHNSYEDDENDEKPRPLSAAA
jgi:hypothetical protein